MARQRLIIRGDLAGEESLTFVRQNLFLMAPGETLGRTVMWWNMWTLVETGWGEDGPHNGTVFCMNFTEGPEANPAPPTPQQPLNNRFQSSIIWFGQLPLTFNNWTQSTGTNSVNNQWLATPAEGVETKGMRNVNLGNIGGVWWQMQQRRLNPVDPFGSWAFYLSFMAVILLAPAANVDERIEWYSSQAGLSVDESLLSGPDN